jgi:hypothetical protein
MTRLPADILRIERDLAYSAARSDIECHCMSVGNWRERWFDPSQKPEVALGQRNPLNDDDRETVAIAIRYLDARGLIERHPDGWVRVREDDAA